MPGDYGGGVIPVPIPNTEVKPSYADDTAVLNGGKVGRRQAFLFFSLGVTPDPRARFFYLYNPALPGFFYCLKTLTMNT